MIRQSLAVALAMTFASTAIAQQFVEIEAAVFTRGADVDADALSEGRKPHFGPDWDEGPAHEVSVAGFQISRDQVTMKQFAEFMPEYRRRIETRGGVWSEDTPATLISWNEATAFCDWRSESTNKPHRLPTEAEWELVASRAEELGISGIADKTQEWCYDWWARYPKQRMSNPQGPENGTVRIVRDGGGGSVEEADASKDSVVDFRVSDRSATVPGDRRLNLGFRIVIGELAERDAGQGDLKRELAGAPFKGVEQKSIFWAKQNIDPLFWAGGKFIDPSADRFASLPYWNRHHVPSLTYCDNGDLLATAFTAAFDNSDQMAILITRLRYGKDKWDPPARFFVAPDHNVTSAMLFNAGNGEIHHYNGLGNNLCEDFSMIKRVSNDHGKTWSEPKIVHRYPVNAATPSNPLGSPRLWPHMDLKSRTDEDGKRTLLMSTDVGAGNKLGSAIFESHDDGDSWQQLTRTGWRPDNFASRDQEAGWIAGIHAPVERLKDGTLFAIGRSNDIDGFSPLSQSSDFGKTWTYSASPFPPILSGQRSVLMRLDEGPLLFISFTDSSAKVRENRAKGMSFENAAGQTENGSGMFAALSFDEGKTWPKRKLIPNWHMKPWKSRYSGYLSCVQTPDDIIHLVNSNFYYRFNLQWLNEPMPKRVDADSRD
jgi:hypothetical protein